MTFPPFIVFSLPRSRSYWLSRFLSYGGCHCAHDQAMHLRALPDVVSWFRQDQTGTVETAAAPWWRLAFQVRPDLRCVVLRRPQAEVIDSMMRSPLPVDRGRLVQTVAQLDRKLEQIAARTGCMSVTFEELNDEAVCCSVFEYCLGRPFDRGWWRELAPQNLQVNLPAIYRYMVAHKVQMDRMQAMATQRIIEGLARDQHVAADDMVVTQEPFESFFQESQALFRTHLVKVEEHPQNFLAKNISLMRALDMLGGMVVTTARSNGRVFGYLMTVLAPSMEHSDVTAVNTLFYADPAVPGLGMKLQRSALGAVRARGIKEIFWRAGPRGDGPRMGALYRRLGAMPDGEQYRLTIGETV